MVMLRLEKREKMQEIVEAPQETKGLTEKQIADRKNWYSQTYIAYLISSYCKGRETMFLNLHPDYRDRVRYLNFGTIDFLFKGIGIPTHSQIMAHEKPQDPFSFFSPKKNYSIYCSLATVDWAKSDVKAFSYHGITRKQQQEVFKEKIEEFLVDFDGFFDMDGDFDGYEGNVPKKIEITQEEAVMRSLRDLRVLIKFLDNYKINYWVQFSGNRGFHAFYKVPLDVSFNRKVEISNSVLKEVAETLNLRTVDKTSLNTRKVAKCCYSLTTKGENTYVCLPLSSEQISSFKLGDMKVNNILRDVRLKDRGLLVRNQNINKAESIDNFKKMLKDLEIQYAEQ